VHVLPQEEDSSNFGVLSEGQLALTIAPLSEGERNAYTLKGGTRKTCVPATTGIVALTSARCPRLALECETVSASDT
jgi:hypothetical protein